MLFKSLAPDTPWWVVGGLAVLAPFVILSYYSVIAGWSISYIVKALSGFQPGIEAAEGLFIGHITGVGAPIFYHFVL